MMTERERAAWAGEVHYDGKPCRYGHGTQRYVSTARCVVCQRARTRERDARIREIRTLASQQ